MNTKKLNLVVLGGVLALTTGFVFGMLTPGIRTARRQRAELREKLRAVAERQREVGNVSALYASILSLDEEMKGLRHRLPKDRQFGDFLSALSDQLKKVGVQDYVVQPREELQLDESRLPDGLRIIRGTSILPVRVSFQGSFAQLFDFLRGVENLPRLSHVESMKTANDEGAPGRMKADILLHTYYHPGVAEDTDATAGVEASPEKSNA